MTEDECIDQQDAIEWLFEQSLGELSLSLRGSIETIDDLEANALIDAVVNFRLTWNL